MEKIASICTMRDLVVALHQLEAQLLEQCALGLNEAMALCAIAGEVVASTDLATRLGLRTAHTSKILGLLERKGLIERSIGQTDKRKMLFALSPQGQEALVRLRELDLTIPDVLRPLFP